MAEANPAGREPEQLKVDAAVRRAEVAPQLPDKVHTWPYLVRAEFIAGCVMILVLLVWSIAIDAPLEEQADPSRTPNPSKAPWYFLGLQEMVAFSAFMGGIAIPAIVILGLALIPYLDRETEGTGEWFGGPGGWPLVWKSALIGLAVAIAVEAFAIRFGWLREWFPAIPQLAITLINPGTLITAAYAAYSIWCIRRHQSARAGALALFTCFLAGFVVLTIIGTYFRGPNWDFFWSPSQWPSGH
jgi:hypothetical protein